MRVSTLYGVFVQASFRKLITSPMFSIPYTSSVSTTAASCSFAFGTISPLNFSARALIAIGKAPLIGCNVPSRLNSPTSIYSLRWLELIFSVAPRIAIASGKSKLEPSLRKSAGARLAVISATGN